MQVNGIVYKYQNKIIYAPKRDLIKDLDTIPFPARHLLDLDELVMNDRLSNTKLPIAHILCSRDVLIAVIFALIKSMKSDIGLGKI